LVLHHAGSLGGTWCALPVSAFQTSPASDLVGLAESLATAAREAALALAAGTAAMQEHDDRVRAAYGRAAHGALAVLHAFRRWTVLEIPATARRLRITRPTVAAAIERLEALGLVTELTGRGRDRVWCYAALADAMLTVPK
jgi:phage tail tape-measure protein